MKKRILQLMDTAKFVMIALLIGLVGKMYAYDFSAVCETGQRLYYNITDAANHHVELTYPGNSPTYPWPNNGLLSGEIRIPSTVLYDGISYLVTSISENAFYDCYNISSVIISNTVTSIRSHAFEFCGLQSITIGSSVLSIGNEAFQGCYNLSQTHYEGDISQWCEISFGNSNSNPISKSHNLFISGVEVTNLVIEGTLHIGGYAFYGFRNLISVTIGNSVNSIGVSSFQGCNGLTTVDLGNSLVSIGAFAFYNCSNISGTLVIPNSVEIIENRAFYNCSGLSSLALGDSLVSINDEAFCGCGSLSGDLVIPNSVNFIGKRSFSGCSSINTVTIGSSVLTIGSDAFEYCTGITKTKYSGTLEQWCNIGFLCDQGHLVSISNPVYYSHNLYINDTKVTDLVIPVNTTSIKSNAFSRCYSLMSVTIPSTVTSFETCAFYGCDSLYRTNYMGSIGQWCEIDFDPDWSNPVQYSHNLFINDMEVTDLILPETVTYIGNYAFQGCNSIVSVFIPNSVSSIGDGTFWNCQGLVTVTIPNSVNSIGNAAFWNCMELVSVTMLSVSVPEIGNNPFYGTNANFGLFVPYESLDAYKTATNWTTYANRIFPMAYTTIPAHGESDGWRFIASPLTANTAPTAVDNMITETPYDLYQFNQSATDGEWQNYKANSFNLANGQSYLYANAEDVNIIFKGNFNEDDTKEVGLAYDANATFAGWNLVGNPFPVSAYANRSYYVMNEEGTDIEPVAISMEMAIPACTGVMVKAENTGETVTFSKTAPGEGANQGVLQIAVAQNNTRGNAIQDKAIVSFSSGDRLEKYIFNKDNAQLYIPQGGRDYAIACVGHESEMPLNFKATKNGQYTICVNLEAVEVSYLYLIDNLTGANVDLLATPNYTFEAKTNDYASRFRLVFSSVCEDTDAADDFAFFSNGNFVINNEGQATLQVVDVTGRIVKSETINGCANVKVDAATGIYMLRLVNGENVKVQKVVAR